MKDIDKNKQKSDVDMLTTCALSIGFGYFALPYTLGFGVCCMAAGAAGIAVQAYGPIKRLIQTKGLYSEEVEKIIKIIEVNEVTNKNGDSLLVEKVTPTNSGFDVEFKIPLGLSYDNVDKIIPAISAALNGIKITRDKNIISAKFTELKEKYDLIFLPVPKNNKNKLMTYVGYSIDGLLSLDLSQAGGILLAGQTGSGKSTLLRYMLTHIATNYGYGEINLYLNDMKFSELMLFKNLKITKWHNTDASLVMVSLEMFFEEMQRRYKLFEEYECTDAYEYERLTGKKIPINLMVIEEFTLISGKKYSAEIDLLNDILSQCRASKSHVIITTQRPDAKNLDPRLKANITHTIGLKTKSIINSQIICDEDVLKYLRGNGHGYVFDNRGDTEFQGFDLSPDTAKKMLEPYNKSKSEIKEFKIKMRDYVGVSDLDEDEGDEF